VLTAVSALGVVVTQNIVRAAAWLLFTLRRRRQASSSCSAPISSAPPQLHRLTVGGTLVLVVFGVMLTAQGAVHQHAHRRRRVGHRHHRRRPLFFGVLCVSLVLGFGERGKKKKTTPAGRRQTAVARRRRRRRERRRQKRPRPADKPAALAPSIVLGRVAGWASRSATAGPPTSRTCPAGAADAHAGVRTLLPFEIVSVHLLGRPDRRGLPRPRPSAAGGPPHECRHRHAVPDPRGAAVRLRRPVHGDQAQTPSASSWASSWSSTARPSTSSPSPTTTATSKAGRRFEIEGANLRAVRDRAGRRRGRGGAGHRSSISITTT